MFSSNRLAHALRMLSVDAVQRARSGHPGMPMGMADIAEVLWRKYLKHNPLDPHWVNRDRFVISNGHGSMLLYALLFITGYNLSLDDLKAFRTLNSKTPGHPEYGETPGVETTTGPLGQGMASACGMALAERCLAEQFNQPGFSLIDHFTYVFVGDGCLMEGISHEACSLAGVWQLGKLIVFWDNNRVSIDGCIDNWFEKDVETRFESYGWHVIRDVNGHDSSAVDRAISEAQKESRKPTLIACQTQIGYGSPQFSGQAQSHSIIFSEDELQAIRQTLNWPYAPFEIPDDVKSAWDARSHGQQQQSDWEKLWKAYQVKYPQRAELFERQVDQRCLPQNWKTWVSHHAENIAQKSFNTATRKSSQHCLERLGEMLPELMGGSADLSGSNCTMWSKSVPITSDAMHGNYIHYGVREFAMFAMMSGLALHGGFIPYGGTFLTFVDYGRNALRLAALMKQKVIYILTHDSIALGEDGPTHQPIEHTAMLRMTPGIRVWRPCDTLETWWAWISALEYQGPSCLLLSRQNLPDQYHDSSWIEAARRGGYVLSDSGENIQLILIATGSEVQWAIKVQQQLFEKHQIASRVVSMPCTEVFDLQDEIYKQSVLPSHILCRVAIEAGARDYWWKYIGFHGDVIGLDQYGKSAPAQDILFEMGFHVDHIVEKALACMN